MSRAAAEKIDHSAEREQFLTFLLGDEVYGIDILCVQEIRGWEAVREIPGAPDFIKGVMNLRGFIVPIIDLRIRFNTGSVEYTPITVNIVLSVNIDGVDHTMGIVVDAVSDVLDARAEDIKPSPKLGQSVNTEFIRGMVMDDDRVVVLMHPDRLLNPDELALLESVEESTTPATTD